MFDCIAGYHLNPWTCGIAKFNKILGERLDVPPVSVLDLARAPYQWPLLSLKLSEFSSPDRQRFDRWLKAYSGHFDVFFHGFDDTPGERAVLMKAACVYCGNHEMYERLRDHRPDIRELWCPGTILRPQQFAPVELVVFTFGMAHKLRLPMYGRLKELLDLTGRTYSIYVSTALHEHTSFDGACVAMYEELQAIFDDRVYLLGYLSDTSVYNHLLTATLVAAFFERGLRANNTTVNAAMECGCAVVTNLDRHSPAGLVHMENVLDITRCERLPDLAEIGRIADNARQTVHARYGWDRLVAELRPRAAAPRGAAALDERGDREAKTSPSRSLRERP
jgi:hypothetical protein